MSTSSAASYEPYDTIRKDNVTSNGFAAAPPRAEYYLQPVPLTPQQQQQQPLLLEHGNGVFQPNARKEFCRLDMRYIRSLEGVVRYLSLPLPFIGLILAWKYLITTSEVWYAALGFAYLFYVAVVFLIETLLAGIFVHRLVDGILTALFAASWLTAAVALTADSITQGASSNVIPLGAPAAFAYIETAIVTLSAVLAFRTWQMNGGKTGSDPLC
eukprot:Em0018g1044a